MEKRVFTAEIECDGVVTDPLDLEVTIEEVNGARTGRGLLDVPACLVGVACNAEDAALVRTDEGEMFRIHFTRIHFPQCVAEFETVGAIPAAGRKVA